MNTIFVNVDTQKDFMRNDEEHQGALYIQEAEKLEARLNYLTKLAASEDVKVVNTADWHTEDSKEFSNTPDYQTSFPPHCLEDTPGAEYVLATKPIDAYIVDWRDEHIDEQAIRHHRNIVIHKDAFDVFAGNPHTNSIYDIIAPERAIVYGVATDVCVDQHIQGLIARGVEVYAVQDAMKEIPIRPLEETLSTWTDNGVTLIQTDEVAAYIR